MGNTQTVIGALFPVAMLDCQKDDSSSDVDPRFDYQCTLSSQNRVGLSMIHLIFMVGAFLLTMTGYMVTLRICQARFNSQLRAMPLSRVVIARPGGRMWAAIVASFARASSEAVLLPPIKQASGLETLPHDADAAAEAHRRREACIDLGYQIVSCVRALAPDLVIEPRPSVFTSAAALSSSGLRQRRRSSSSAAGEGDEEEATDFPLPALPAPLSRAAAPLACAARAGLCRRFPAVPRPDLVTVVRALAAAEAPSSASSSSLSYATAPGFEAFKEASLRVLRGLNQAPAALALTGGAVSGSGVAVPTFTSRGSEASGSVTAAAAAAPAEAAVAGSPVSNAPAPQVPVETTTPVVAAPSSSYLQDQQLQAGVSAGGEEGALPSPAPPAQAPPLPQAMPEPVAPAIAAEVSGTL